MAYPTDPTLAPGPVAADPNEIAPSSQTPAADPTAPTEENKAAILKLIREKETEWGRGREGFVRAAWRNLLFERGHQDIVFSRMTNSWRPVRMTGPRIIPTNRFSSTMGAYVSVLARIEPLLTFRPATDEPADRAAAEVASRAIEVIEDEVNVRLTRQRLAHWAGFTGGAWIETGYDPSPQWGTRLQQDDQCLACQQVQPPAAEALCGVCGGPTEPAIDEQGAPMGRQVPIGKMYQDVVSCFEMWFDASYEDWRDVPDYIRKKSLSTSAAIERWGEDAKGVGTDLQTTMGEQYQDQLPTLSGYMAETGPGPSQPIARGQAQRVSEKWYYSRPNATYPQGVCAVVLGGSKVVSLGPLRYQDERGPMLNTVYFPTRLVPGSLWSKTVADDLASKQVERNQLCYFIMRLIMRTANPVWMVPEGANVAHFTGEPGQLLRYNALGTAKPERIQGAGIPNGLLTWLQIIDSDFEELAATFSVMKGDRPSGVSAGIALQLLQERANNRFGPMFILWEQAWAECARQMLAIFKQFATEERLLKIQGAGSRWRVEKFMGSDLKGRIDVVPEAGSSLPRSTMVARAELEQLSANGVIDPHDPEIRDEWLREYNRSNWLPGMKADAENAAKQIEFFEELAGQPQAVQMIAAIFQEAQAIQQHNQMLGFPAPPATYAELAAGLAKYGLEVPEVRPTVDDHMVMARELGNWLKGDASQQLPKPIQKLVEAKHMLHVQIAQQQAMMRMQTQGGTYPTSGFLSNPGGQQGPSQSPPSTPPSRMQGEQQEQDRNAQAVA